MSVKDICSWILNPCQKIRRFFCTLRFLLVYRRWIGKKNVRSLVLDSGVNELVGLIDGGHVAIDGSRLVVQIDMGTYSKYLCNGSFSMIDEIKAHLFFLRVRTWINLTRAYSNASEDTQYVEVWDSTRIIFGVVNAEGNVILVGDETKESLNVRPYEPLHRRDNA